MPQDLLATMPQAPQAGATQPVDLLAQAPAAQAPAGAAPTPGAPPTPAQPEGMTLLDILKGSAGLSLGTAQGLSKMGYGLAQLGDKGINALTQKLFGKDFHLQAGKPSVYFGPAEHLKGTLPAKIGEDVLAPAIGLGAGGEGLVGAGAGMLPKMAAFGAMGAATQPGGLGARAIAGGLSAFGGGLEHLMSTIPYMFRGTLGRAIEKIAQQHKGLSKMLYGEAFKGTGDIVPKLSGDTKASLSDLARSWETKSNPVSRALNRYNKEPTPSNLHTLRSDLRKAQNNLTKTALKSGLTGSDINKVDAFKTAVPNLSKDLEATMSGASPENYNKYLIAQKHWRENLLPLRHFSSVRNLLGPEREVSTRLYTDLSKDSVSAAKLRELLHTNMGSMQLARIMHHKFMGLPLPVYLALPGGYALYHHANLGEH